MIVVVIGNKSHEILSLVYLTARQLHFLGDSAKSLIHGMQALHGAVCSESVKFGWIIARRSN